MNGSLSYFIRWEKYMKKQKRKILAAGLSLIMAIQPYAIYAEEIQNSNIEAQSIEEIDPESVMEETESVSILEESEMTEDVGYIYETEVEQEVILEEEDTENEEISEFVIEEETEEIEEETTEADSVDTYTNSDDLLYGDYTYVVSGNEATITGYIGVEKNISLPEKINGYEVISIGEEAFRGCKELESIYIPKNIIEIEDAAFLGCIKLIHVQMEDSNEKELRIYDSVFSGCSSLSEIILPERVIYLGERFISGTSIASITIPKNVEVIDSIYRKFGVLEGAYKLKEVIYGEGTKNISNGMCAGNKEIVKVKLPGTVEAIKNQAFQECTALESIYIPESVTSIGTEAFEGCIALESIYIPRNVTSIGAEAFKGCRRLGHIQIERGKKELNIYGSAFEGCLDLKELILPENVTYLGENFISGTSITSIIIPKNIKGAGCISISYKCYGALTGADKLEKIEFEEGTRIIFKGMCCGNIGITDVIIPETVETIGEEAFSECTALKRIEIPKSVTSIEFEAFYGCTNLETIILHETVTNINFSAFEYCGLLTIYGYSGSYAETYAKDNNIPFVALDGEEERGKGFNLTKDGYCICNSKAGFSYSTWKNMFGILGYKISLERYQEVYGNSYTKHIYEQNISAWDGNCFGMAATATLFYKNKLPVVNYTHDVGTLAAGGYDEMATDFSGRTYLRLKQDSELTKLIERYQIWQESVEYDRLKIRDALNYNQGSDSKIFSNIIERVNRTKEPFIVLVYWDDPDAPDGRAVHALVIDSSRPTRTLENNWVRIFLYDPNNPYFAYFDKKNPTLYYTQAENRFLDVNTSNGQWRMDVKVNGSGKNAAAIGYDSSGNLIKHSYIMFNAVNEYPTNFSEKATFSPKKDNVNISYASDNFEVYNSSNVLIYKMQNGSVTYIDNTIVTPASTCGYAEDSDAGISHGKLILPEGEYSVTVESGAISYMADGNYAGIVTKDKASVKNVDSTTLSIISTDSNKVNVVIEDIQSDNYTSVATDIIASDSGCKISLDDNELSFITDGQQKIDVSVIADGQEKKIENIQIDNSTNVEIKEEHTEHVWNSGEIIISATCTRNGIRTYTCNVCGEIRKENIPANGHKFISWETISRATVFHAEVQKRICIACGNVQQRTVGTKLEPVLKLNATSVTLKTRQKTTGLKVLEMQKGDAIQSWKSSNTKIVKVSGTGMLTAQKKTGKATVTVTLKSGISKNITVKVQKGAVKTTRITGLNSRMTISRGSQVTLRPVLQPFTSVEKIKYSSSNKKIVSVTSKGKIKGIKPGKAKITVRAGRKKFVVTVTVNK